MIVFLKSDILLCYMLVRYMLLRRMDNVLPRPLAPKENCKALMTPLAHFSVVCTLAYFATLLIVRSCPRPLHAFHQLLYNRSIRQHALGLRLASAGFDVFLGNARGNRYSHKVSERAPTYALYFILANAFVYHYVQLRSNSSIYTLDYFPS